MKKSELQFRNVLNVLDESFADYMLQYPYELLEVDGITKINPFEFQKDYWSRPTEEVSINPNANLGNVGFKKSFVNLNSEINAPVQKLSALYLIRKYGNKRGFDGDNLVQNIVNGKVYHHNLTLYNLPYCIGLSVYPIISDGLDFFNTLTSNPPKRPSSFVTLVTRYVQYASNLFAGATALTDFFPNYSYYTVEKSDYSDKQRENDMQCLVHGVTDEVRLSGQSPFCNLSISSPDTLRSMLENYVWGKYKIDDLIDETMKNQLAYIRFFSKGILGSDKKPLGIPYRFPITTLVADPSFEKEYPEIWNEIISSNANLCYLNILSNYGTDLKSLAMCCRLTQSLEDMLSINVGNTFGSYLTVGSHEVVSINLPHIALETKDESKFMEILRERLEVARKLLLIHREEILQKRRLKYHYFFASKKIDLKRNMFSTIGFIGLPNAIEILFEKNFLGTPIMTKDGLEFAKKILKVMKDETVRFSKEDGYMYNLEEVPAESSSGTLALKDKMLSNGDYEFYDSQFVPLSYDVPLSEKIRVEGELQSFCTGGSIAHLNLGGYINDESSADSLTDYTKLILANSKLNHFAFNKGFTLCENHHSSQGINQICPTCGSKNLEWITRIVGYFVPTRMWNKAKQKEFSTRKWMKLG